MGIRGDLPMKVISVVGARPQFIKAAACSRAIAENNCEVGGEGEAIAEILVHTGQHYDDRMSGVFFRDLGMPSDPINLGVGSGSHGQQTAAMLVGLERVIGETGPDWVMLYGDTNSTLAGALAAAKLHVPIAHVEAGVRSFNRQMPEEVNRVVTDHLAQLSLCPTDTAVANLALEGITAGVVKVGDVMLDSMLFHLDESNRAGDLLAALDLWDATEERAHPYYLATIHRPENTNSRRRMEEIVSGLTCLDAPVVLPVHPRTAPVLEEMGVGSSAQIRCTDPVSYFEMISLEASARAILTDSGGVQKEAYFLGIPCVTLRDETEWVETVEEGWNAMAGADSARIVSGVREVAAMRGRPRGSAFGDPGAARRVVSELVLAREQGGT
ncbi:non-hydrolyzing UDP-N-acetylglucosamine 2-epimerase [Candidatus Latescibacterota bacterium]